MRRLNPPVNNTMGDMCQSVMWHRKRVKLAFFWVVCDIREGTDGEQNRCEPWKGVTVHPKHSASDCTVVAYHTFLILQCCIVTSCDDWPLHNLGNLHRNWLIQLIQTLINSPLIYRHGHKWCKKNITHSSIILESNIHPILLSLSVTDALFTTLLRRSRRTLHEWWWCFMCRSKYRYTDVKQNLFLPPSLSLSANQEPVLHLQDNWNHDNSRLLFPS